MLDNPAIAHTLGEIADLLELKGDNPFKIRAYRSAADSVAASAESVAGLDAKGLQQWPGIG
jgi:DNA polymerase (family 10)